MYASAAALTAPTMPPAMAADTMIFWLAQAAKELREAKQRKQVHIAATINRDQSTIYRFEYGDAWPRQIDLIIAGYADDLDIDDARVIWRKALEMWEAQGKAPSVPDLIASSNSPAGEFGQALDDAAPAPDESKRRPARTPAAKATRRRAG